ncbi:MAG: hypothetical protein LM573_00570 [Thermofilum sp.]|nr:hypothetical protein [Thermofilum sp.]
MPCAARGLSGYIPGRWPAPSAECGPHSWSGPEDAFDQATRYASLREAVGVLEEPPPPVSETAATRKPALGTTASPASPSGGLSRRILSTKHALCSAFGQASQSVFL